MAQAVPFHVHEFGAQREGFGEDATLAARALVARANQGISVRRDWLAARVEVPPDSAKATNSLGIGRWVEGLSSLLVEMGQDRQQQARRTEPAIRQLFIARDVLDAFSRVDILINAAGVNSGTPFFEIAEDEWQRIIDINLKGVFLGSQVFGKAMVESGQGGSIIMTSSSAALKGASGICDYTAAKMGLVGMARTMARACAGATAAFSRTSSDSACIAIDLTSRAKRAVNPAGNAASAGVTASRERENRPNERDSQPGGALLC